MKISLVIPAFNEEQRIQPFLHSIVNYLRQHPAALQEIIVVDDGSSDNTFARVKKFESSLPQLKVVRLTTNVGKGAAIQQGVNRATGNYIIFMDADGATAITELPKMVAALAQAPVAIGNRWLPGAQSARHSLIRQFAGWTYRTYMRLFGLGAIDTMCGFKGYHANVAHTLFNNLLEKRWLFDTEVAYKAVQAGLPIENFPIAWESKDGSKLSLRDQLIIAFQIWPLINRIKQQQRQHPL
jgi:dolichyl-phosphate beta-glucosyltransferase